MSLRRLSKRARLLAAGAALAVLGSGGFVVHEEFIDDRTVCCAVPPPLHNVPRGPDGEIDIASQSTEPEVLVDHDFSLHVRPGGDADDWRLAESGESGGVVRAKGEKTVKGTHYFRFRALKTGTARIVLKEIDGERTMTYLVTAREGEQVSGVEHDPDGILPAGSSATPADGYEPDDIRVLDADFDSTVTVRAGETFRIANRYANQPGYTWQFVTEPEGPVLREGLSEPPAVGDAAAARQDWYEFNAYDKGIAKVRLFGCYRCGYDDKPTTAESKKFSVVKKLTVIVS
ncbi:hypothetical protein [Streptomyces cavernicola]|uniref:Proteinase inhibitor I42 chagasin domain-containing protein n=1 Tax=Streptomyces cavernicola TaxID=3043613 RepID=A0ABT6S8V0_9ACTN|nr:hypothetical protein [Streptomyces sp. B-S-A6]MDI3404445.1 hypothetical protein [Streptomyces sp. B-S-A6]